MLGAIFVLLVGLMARRLFGTRVAGRAMVLTALFPGSFVLSFAYSEATMLVLVAGCLLMLMDRRWLLAGVLAGLATASRPNAIAIIASCAVAAGIAIVQRREWKALIAPLLAPVGWLSFQLFLGHQTGEAGVWFRVQSEAWDEGTSFGLTAIKSIGEAFAHPLNSPRNILTVLCVVAMLFGLWAMWKRPLPIPVTVYTLGILALMLLPQTVTARPRFLFTAFPLLIAVAAIWPDRDEEMWPLLLAACGAGLTAVTALYGAFGAIPFVAHPSSPASASLRLAPTRFARQYLRLRCGAPAKPDAPGLTLPLRFGWLHSLRSAITSAAAAGSCSLPLGVLKLRRGAPAKPRRHLRFASAGSYSLRSAMPGCVAVRRPAGRTGDTSAPLRPAPTRFARQ